MAAELFNANGQTDGLDESSSLFSQFCEHVQKGNGITVNNDRTMCILSGSGDLEVACWPLVPKFAGSHPAEAVRFLGRKKNPQHAFLRRGSKAVGPMS